MATTNVADPARAVLNHPPPLQPVDLLAGDLALAEGLQREGGGWDADAVHEAALVAGGVVASTHGRRAERNSE